MNAYPDKQEKWLQNPVPHPLCFACENEFESWQHLFFSCQKTQNIKSFLNLQNWKDIWLKKLTSPETSCSTTSFIVVGI